jgi:ubiquinone/menaquinone biosynthesis C-methylase UbiE
VTTALFAAIEPGPDDEVLELACGTGEVAAALAGTVARILATDLSPAMVAAAERRGVEARALDMQELDLADESFDAVVCRYGYMLVPDPARALHETRRVLRPDGRLAFATWAEVRRNPWATVFGPSLAARGLLEPPQPGEPGQFALGETAAIESLVRGAGFAEVAVEEVPVRLVAASFAEYAQLQTSVSTRLREALASVEGPVRAEIDEESRARFERHADGDGYLLPGLALVTRAR